MWLADRGCDTICLYTMVVMQVQQALGCNIALEGPACQPAAGLPDGRACAACSAGGQAEVPWAGGGKPRFVCDANLEGLARQLRMCGLDVTCVPRPDARMQRFAVHRCTAARPASAPPPHKLYPPPKRKAILFVIGGWDDAE